jgi:glycosyltransferase involved in cell wall biosynthesis
VTALRIVQTSIGRFHHFDLARQMHRLGLLEAIFTGYPRWKLRQENLPPEKIRTFPWLQTIYMAASRTGFHLPGLQRELAWRSLEALDSFVVRNLPDCDVFIGLSGTGLKTGREARRRGGKCVCDRGSSHIRYQDRILREEFSRWGQKFAGVDPRIIAREEAEYAAADMITVPSRFAHNSFVCCGVPASKLRLISYGVELSRFKPQGVPHPHEFIVLAVGQISFRKGFPYLLKAFQKLKHPRKRLLMVGAVQPEMEAWLRGENLDGVEFARPKTQVELPAIMSRAHALVLASVEDGFGLVLPQAMACGCPVIATENTGAPDLISDGSEGFVVPIRDASAITDRLERFAQDQSLRARMSEAAMERVKCSGGWHEYGAAFASLCAELAGLRTPEAFCERQCEPTPAGSSQWRTPKPAPARSQN